MAISLMLLFFYWAMTSMAGGSPPSESGQQLTLVQRQASKLHKNSISSSDEALLQDEDDSQKKPGTDGNARGWMQSDSIGSDSAWLYHDLSTKHGSYLKEQMEMRNMSSNVTSTFTMLTTLYLTDISQHTVECLAALATNLDVPHIGSIHILIEAEEDECLSEDSDPDANQTEQLALQLNDAAGTDDTCDPLISALMRFGFSTRNREKLTCIPVHGNPTYADFTRYMNEHLRGMQVLLTNSDIVFDATLADVKVDELQGGKKVYVLSVKPPLYHNPTTHQSCHTTNRCNLGMVEGWNGTGNSWDTYVLVPPLPDMDLSNVQHPMNLIGAENSYAYTLHLRGQIKLVNMCQEVNAIHWHCAKKSHGDWSAYPVQPERYGNLMPSATGNQDCSQGTLMAANDTRIQAIYKIGQVTTKLCCENGVDLASCEQAWYRKRYPLGKVGNRSAVICEDSDETGCAVWLGDPLAKTTVACPPPKHENFTEVMRMICNWEFGPLWPFSAGSAFPTLVAMQLDDTQAAAGVYEPNATNTTKLLANASTEFPDATEVIPFYQDTSNLSDRIRNSSENLTSNCIDTAMGGNASSSPNATQAGGGPQWKCGDRLLIFCEGKGASTSLTMAMQNATGLRADFGYFDNDWEHALKTHKANEALDFVNRAPGGTTVWLVTIIRNFVHQVVSSLFEDFHYNIYGFMKTSDARGKNAVALLKEWKPKLFEAELATMSEDDLMNHLIEQKLMLPQRFNSDFLKPIIGVDLSDVPFDHERSRQFISLKFADGKQLNVIGLRYEDLSKWNGVLREYFPLFPEEITEQQRHEEELLVERYEMLKEFLDNSGYFNALSLEELRSYPNQNYYTDCEVKALAHLTEPVDLASLSLANSTCSPVPTLAPTPYPMDTLGDLVNTTSGIARQRKRCNSSSHDSTSPNGTQTEAPTGAPIGTWKHVVGCFNRSEPWKRIAKEYCGETPSPTSAPTRSPTAAPTVEPTVHGHWVITIECQDQAGRQVSERNCPGIHNKNAFVASEAHA
jgi:hypothetical protein